MTGTSRRRILQMLTAAAVVPALASREAAATGQSSLIAPPAGAMQFRRSVIRQLVGGARISVTRDFTIRFVPFADGFIVEGSQSAVDVRTPANLAAFAELERARVETAMFPITLDPFGQIVSEEVSSGQAEQITLAFNEAISRITNQPLDSGERGEIREFITALHQAGDELTVLMPFDLFSPLRNERAESLSVPLPTGDIGRVISRFDAERDFQTGLLRRALREVRTEVEGDRRQTFEHWQLRPA